MGSSDPQVIDQAISDKIDTFFSSASKSFIEEQRFIAQVVLMRKSGEMIVIPANDFFENESTKLILSFTVQFLCALWGDVDCVLVCSEVYALEAPSGIDEAQLRAYRAELHKKYGSIENCPGRTESLLVVYDDGEHSYSKSAQIMTTDAGTKTLDVENARALGCVTPSTESARDNILGALLHKSNRLAIMANEMKSRQSLLLQSTRHSQADVLRQLAHAMAQQLQMTEILIGYEYALQFAKDQPAQASKGSPATGTFH